MLASPSPLPQETSPPQAPLDLSHLSCPLPFVHLHRQMRKLSEEEHLSVWISLGTTFEEITPWAEKMGYCATLVKKNEDKALFLLTKKR